MAQMAQVDLVTDVLRLRDANPADVASLLARYGLVLERVPASAAIPGSYWGEAEAGLQGDRLLARPDTPLHSILHEACHFVCMEPDRRAGLDTDAGGDYDEENGVCYLQILLAGHIAGFGAARMMADMDAWGYSFRLGSAQRWFEEDAEDARAFLETHQLIDTQGRPTWTLRNTSTNR